MILSVIKSHFGVYEEKSWVFCYLLFLSFFLEFNNMYCMILFPMWLDKISSLISYLSDIKMTYFLYFYTSRSDVVSYP